MPQTGLILPALALMALGWLVPRLLSRIWPEGVRPLLLLALVATILMFLVAGAVFVVIYTAEGVPLPVLLEPGLAAFLAHFGGLALSSALFWAPMLILSVAALPRYWVKERW